MIPVRLVLASLLAAATGPASATDVSIEVVNASSLTLMELYASPVDDGAWGKDLLNVHVLPPGETGRFPITESSTRCDYSLRFVLEDGRERLGAADLCDAPSYRIEDAR